MNTIARKTCLAFAALVGSSSLALAQTVYVVDQAGGAGSTHTTIGEAVTAAVDGDFLLVREGIYVETLELDGKGLTVQAEAGADVEVCQIVVKNLAANQVAAIRGIDVASFSDRLLLTSNAGPVWIEDLRGCGNEWWGGRIQLCQAVVLRNCVTGSVAYVLDSTPGLCIANSTVALYECHIRGDDGFAATDGGPGLHVDASRVTLYGTDIVGGNGGDSFTGQFPGNGGEGVWVIQFGVVDVIDSLVQGGAGGFSPFGDGLQGPDYLTVTGGTVNELEGTARIFTAESPLRSHEPAIFTFNGVPGDRAFVMVSTEPGSFSYPRDAVGPLVIPAGSLLIDYGTIPASGTFTTTCNAPPAASADSYFIQAYFQQGIVGSSPFLSVAPGTQSEIAIGTPTQIHVFDESY